MKERAKDKVDSATPAEATGATSSAAVVVASSLRFSLRAANRKWLVGGIAVLVILIAVVGVLVYKHFHQNGVAPSRVQTFLTQAKQEPVPADNRQKATHYAYLASSYYDAGDYQQALTNYLKADSYITVRKPGEPGNRSVYVGIAETYTKLGNKAKAREYYQREISRLQGTDNADTIKYLQQQEAKL